MDWTYKHFNREATFTASPEMVLEAARAAAAESLGQIGETSDGFVGRGYNGWHSTTATFRLAPTSDGTQVSVELLVERASLRSYMLFDVGGFYNGLIDKWFSGISERLAGTYNPNSTGKATFMNRIWSGCLPGCIVYIVVGTILPLIAMPLDHFLASQSSVSTPGPFSLAAYFISFIIGILAFLYFLFPDAPLSKSLSARLKIVFTRKK